MSIAYISDIHGNATALEAVLEDIKQQNIDQIVVLGDLCFRGPEPKKSLDLIRELDAPVIKGNADAWVTRGIRIGEVPEKVIKMMREEQEWTCTQLTDDDMSYLRELPEQVTESIGDKKVYGFHATPDSLFEVVKPDSSDEDLRKAIMEKEEADIYLYGHIHIPYVRYIDGKTVANLGSVGLPFDEDPRASYLIVNEEGPKIRKVSYDIDQAVQKLYDHDYPQPDLVANVYRTGKL